MTAFHDPGPVKVIEVGKVVAPGAGNFGFFTAATFHDQGLKGLHITFQVDDEIGGRFINHHQFEQVLVFSVIFIGDVFFLFQFSRIPQI